MAEIVASYVVPHTPSFMAALQARDDAAGTIGHFGQVRSHLEQAAPDLIVAISNDHFNTFFFENWPTFAIGVADRTAGPSDQTPGMPWSDVAVDATAARHVLRSLVEDGFDFAQLYEFELDHAFLVPLHFMTPELRVPIVPVFINCLVPLLPTARRCHQLGQALSQAIASLPHPARVAVIASGSLSLEIGGPRAAVGKTFGVPDPSWAAWILERVRRCEHDALMNAAVESRMLEAGNVAGELLIWITALGLVGPRRPDILINQSELGNGFAAWRGQGPSQ